MVPFDLISKLLVVSAETFTSTSVYALMQLFKCEMYKWLNRYLTMGTL